MIWNEITLLKQRASRQVPAGRTVTVWGTTMVWVDGPAPANCASSALRHDHQNGKRQAARPRWGAAPANPVQHLLGLLIP